MKKNHKPNSQKTVEQWFQKVFIKTFVLGITPDLKNCFSELKFYLASVIKTVYSNQSSQSIRIF